MNCNTNYEPEERKKWRSTINYYFSSPALAVFLCLLVKWTWIAVGIFLVFGCLLVASGVPRIFKLLPLFTRCLMVTAPLVFVLGWVLGEVNAGQAASSVLLIVYCILQIISNLSIPPYIESHRTPDSTDH